jgi:hypothetical protein
LFRNCYQADGGYRIDIPTRFPTVFETHKKSEGHRIAYLLLERTEQIPGERLPAADPRPVSSQQDKS